MKNIDNRYEVLELLESNALFDLFRVRDEGARGSEKNLKLYGKELRNQMFETLLNEGAIFSKMRHPALVHFEEFRYLHMANGKPLPTDLWYTVTEPYEERSLRKSDISEMSLSEKLLFLLRLIQVIDYLNYVDFSYPLLLPENILMTQDGPKLRDVGSLEEQKHYALFSDFSKFFLSPWFLQNRMEKNRRSDHYALARLIRFVLIDNYREENFLLWKPRDPELRPHLSMIAKYVSEMQEASKLVDFMPDEFLTTEGSYLTMMRREWTRIFQLDFEVDFARERGNVNYKEVIAGYSEQISRFDSFVRKIRNGELRSGGILVEAERGSNRSALFAEYARRLELRGEPVFFFRLNPTGEMISVTVAKALLSSPMIVLSEEERAKLEELVRCGNTEEDQMELLHHFRLIYGVLQKASRRRRFYLVIDGEFPEFVELFLKFTGFAEDLLESGKMMLIFSVEGVVSEIPTHAEEIASFAERYQFVKQSITHYSETEIAKYIKACLGMPFLPMSVSEEIFHETFGNPSYVEYAVRNMMESGYFYIDPVEGAWFIDVGNFSEISTSSYFDTRDSEQKEEIQRKYWDVLSRLSVFMLGTSVEMLSKLGKYEHLNQSLEELIQMKVVGKRIRENECFFKIVFAEMRNGTYSKLAESERKQLHSTVANLLPSMYPAHSFSMIDECVYQMKKADRLEDAVKYLSEELAYALTQEDVTSRMALLKRKVESIYEDALSCVRSEIMLDLLNQMIYLCFMESDFVGMDRYVKDSLRLSAKNGHLDYHLEALYYLTELQFNEGKLNEMRKTLDEMERLSRKHVSASGFIRTYITEGRYHIRTGDRESAVKCLKRAERMSQEYGVSEYLGVIYARMGLADFFAGKMESAKKYHEMAKDAFSEQNDYIMEIKMINNLVAFYDEGVMTYEEVTRYVEEGLAKAQKYRCLNVEALLYKNIALICFADFDVVSAYQYQMKAYDLCMHLNVKSDIHEALIFMARCEVYFGEYAKALETLKEAERYFEGEDRWDLEQRINYYYWMGDIYSGFGKMALAVEYLEKAMDASRGVNPRKYYEAFVRYFQSGNAIGKDLPQEDLEEIESYFATLSNRNSLRYFLLTAANIMEMTDRHEEAMGYVLRERSLENREHNSILDALSDLVMFYLEPTDENLEALKRNQKFYVNEPVLDFYYFFFLARAFDRRKEFGVAIRNYIHVLNIIYTSIYDVEDIEIKRIFGTSYGGDEVRGRILEIAGSILGKTYPKLRLMDLNEEEFERYFDLSEALQSLDWRMLAPGSTEEWDDYASVDEKLTLSDVVLHLGTKYQQNLEMLLHYLTKKTLSQHAAVVVFDRETDGKQVVAAVGSGADRTMMNEPLLSEMQSAENFILVDVRNKRQHEKKSYLIRGEKKSLLAVPFRFEGHYAELFRKHNDRREPAVQSTRNNGFISLEADTMLHNFTEKVVEEMRPIFNLIRTNVNYYLMRRIALFDYLTGCLSRRRFDLQFDELIDSLRTYKARCSLLMLDIDNFKSVNDTYGHQVGDEVLRKLGEILRNNVRKTDIVARYGGEEFVVVLPTDSEETANVVAEKIRSEMEQTNFEGVSGHLTISIGIAHFPKHSQLKDDLIKKADMALYESKRTGKNRATVWKEEIGEGFHHSDKLAGIVTGRCDVDNKLMLSVFDIANLLREEISVRKKMTTFLYKVKDMCDLDDACLLLLEEGRQDCVRWEEVMMEEAGEQNCNFDWILSVLDEEKIGVYRVDWEGHFQEESTSWGDWISYMAVPLFKSGARKAVLVGWTKLKRKELGREDFNRATLMAEIFAGVLE